jgi:hypothetical protein
MALIRVKICLNVLTILAVAVSGFLWRNSAAAEAGDRQPLTAIWDLQKRCADAAHQFHLDATKDEREDSKLNRWYENHYNARLNKCFVVEYSYSLSDDITLIDLYDALERKHYASYHGRDMCDPRAQKDSSHCMSNAGDIWFGGDDQSEPDISFGFEGVLNGPRIGDQNTKREFLDAIKPFITQ